jgi:voltage-gated potassium channel
MPLSYYSGTHMNSGKGIDSTVVSYNSKNIIRALFMLGLVLLIGTMGYMGIEGWSPIDSLYMTIITITTVGFKEVHDVSPPGQVFTVFLIFMGMGIIAYALGMVAQIMVELQVRSILGRRKLGLKIKSIKNHYIICGYGRIGRIISQELKANGIPLLVIDNNSDSKQVLDQQDIPYVIDDATSEDVLLEAGIERAKGLVSVVLSDADNLFITMTARGLNPDLFILARADEEHTNKKLLRAGANRVVLPYLIGGRKMAHTITKPAVTDFLELTVHDKDIDLEMGELLVNQRSRLNGVTLSDSGIRQEMNVIIVAIRKKSGDMTFNPSSGTRIETDDTLIALGESNDLQRLSSILSG